jgi:hypothetical protein
MTPLCVATLALAAWSGALGVRSAGAQDVDARPPLPARTVEAAASLPPGVNGFELAQRMREVKKWMADYTAWKRWNDTWRNRLQPGWFGTADRKKRPEPPAWLDQDCLALADTQGVLADACRLLADANEDLAAAQMRAQTAVRRTQDEHPTKTVWWEHIHFDALWAMPQVDSRVFGVVGIHATTEIAGRFQVFLAPGALVLYLPTSNGTREYRPATDWGIAYRVFDFTFPGTDQRGSVHLNLAKAWVFTGPANTLKTGVDMAGFSLTLKRTPRHTP